MPQSRNQNDEQQDQGHDQQGNREPLQHIGADAEEQRGARGTDERQQQLPLQVVERLPRLLARNRD